MNIAHIERLQKQLKFAKAMYCIVMFSNKMEFQSLGKQAQWESQNHRITVNSEAFAS